VDERGFYATDPRRECCERVLAEDWIVDGTARTAQIRWYAHTGEVVVVDRGCFEVWAVERDERNLAPLLSAGIKTAKRLSRLRAALAAPRANGEHEEYSSPRRHAHVLETMPWKERKRE
jgi:hypothetical protein